MTDYSSTTVWLLICIIGVGTFSLRFALIALADKGNRIPDSIQRALRFIPPAVLAAIAAPAFLLVDDAVDITTENLRLFAGLVAYLVARSTKSVLWTIGSGMVALWMLQLVT